MELFLLATGMALGVSFLCSILEASLLSLTPYHITQIEATSPKSGAIWRRFKASIDKPIAVILVLNTTAHTIGATIAGAEFASIYGEENVIIFSLLFTMAMLQFTEVLPKSLGVRFNRQLAPIIAQPLNGLMKIMAPLLWIIHLLNKPFQGKAEVVDMKAASVAELASMTKIARATKAIGDQEQRIITSTTTLQTQTVNALMVPKGTVVSVTNGISVREHLRYLRANPYGHLPVLTSTTDPTICGFVSFEDMTFLYLDNNDATDLTAIIRPIPHVPETMPANQLLALLSDSGDPIAMVEDSNHVYVGLVSLMDVMEELLGEISDDDELPKTCAPRAGGFLVGGGLPVQELARRCKVEWSDTDPGQTVNDWLSDRLGDQITLGRVWSEGDIRFSVRRLRTGRIAELDVRLPESSSK